MRKDDALLLVHQYFHIKIDRIWEIATTEILPLVEVLEAVVPPEGAL